MTPFRTICVYCGSYGGADPAYLAAADQLGRLIAQSGLRLVYGGGGTGMMGRVATAALDAGGAVTGIIPGFLREREKQLSRVQDLRVVPDMHTRKMQLMRESDGFVVMPGGLGTLEEFFEVVTWRQLGLHDKPIVVADVGGYWAALDNLLAHVVDQGFAAPTARALYQVASQVDQVLPLLRQAPAPALPDQPALI